jgi:hypothetical protein
VNLGVQRCVSADRVLHGWHLPAERSFESEHETRRSMGGAQGESIRPVSLLKSRSASSLARTPNAMAKSNLVICYGPSHDKVL